MDKVIVKVGLLGVGFMGQVVHLDNYVRVPDCEVKAICDVRPKLLEAVAGKYRIPKVYLDFRELIQDKELDGIICCQPPVNTYPLAREVLEGGKHLLTQSPMATRLDDARELVDLAEENGRVYGVGCMKRFDLGVERARMELIRLYKTGELGALLRVDAHCFGGDWINEIRPPIDFPDEPSPPHPEPRLPEFLKKAHKQAYMEYLKVYTHNINLIRYLMPGGKLKFVHALIANPNGCLSHTSSFRLEHVPVCLRGTVSQAHEWQEETTFIFEQGHLTIKTPTPLRMQAAAKVEVYRSDGGEGELHTLHSPRLWAFMLQAAGFAGAVAGISGFRSPGMDSIEDVAIVEEVFKKAKFV
jgi:predicted dehydrogenase